MNLATLIAKRAEEGRPIRVGMIGAGKFGTMFLAQAERQRGIHIIGICDLNPEATRSNLALANWNLERYDSHHNGEQIVHSRHVVNKRQPRALWVRSYFTS